MLAELGPCPDDTEVHRRRWAGRTGRLRILGLDVEVVSDRPEVTTYLASVFAPFEGRGAAATTVAMLERNGAFPVAHAGEWVLAPTSLPQAVVSLVWWLNQRSLEAPWHELLVHAGVVATGGRAVLLPGAPDAGKSTLTAALVRDGFEYLSDEAARIDLRTGTVHPFPRSLTLDSTSLALLGLPPTAGVDAGAFPEIRALGAHVPVDALRTGAVGGPAAPALVVFPRLVDGATPSLTPVPPAAALGRLTEEALNLHTLGRAGFALLHRLVAGRPAVELRYSALPNAVGAIRRALDQLRA